MIERSREIDVPTDIECVLWIGDTYAHTPLRVRDVRFPRVHPLFTVDDAKITNFPPIRGRRREIRVFPIHIRRRALDVLVIKLSRPTETDGDHATLVVNHDLLPIFCGCEETRDRGLREECAIVVKTDFIVTVIERKRVAVSARVCGGKHVCIERTRVRA